MTRLYLNQTLEAGQLVDLSKEQRHYLERVLRFQVGQSFLGFNQICGEWEIVYEKSCYRCVAQTLTPCFIEPSWLAFAPLKHDPMTFLIEKATELGVTNLQPILTERTNTQRVNLERLQKNAIEAAQQCERLDIPAVHEPMGLSVFLQSLPQGVHWYSAIERSEETCQVKYPAGFIIGPEGGWTEKEKELLKRHSTNLSLGKNILRAETAAVVCLGLKFYKYN
jgi:16S rRNA (uracil1498-N3)-methyltransferase